MVILKEEIKRNMKNKINVASEKMQKWFYKLEYAVTGLFLWAFVRNSGLVAYAADVEWLDDKPTDDIFGDATKAVQNITKSGVSLMTALGIASFAIALMWTFIKLGIGRKEKKVDAKGDLGWIVIAILGFFGMYQIIKLIATISGGIKLV